MNNIKDSAWGKYDLYRSMMSSDGFLQGTLLLDETFKQLKGEGGERTSAKLMKRCCALRIRIK